MELRHIRYFVAVAEALSFTRAATRLRVAHPAWSRQVADLEDELGVDLLKRTPLCKIKAALSVNIVKGGELIFLRNSAVPASVYEAV